MARNPLTPYRSGGLLGGGIDPLFSLHRDMNRLFDEVFSGGALPAAGGGQGQVRSVINAQMNVSETADAIRITAELPGVGEGDIEVSLDDDVLTIRGEKKFERTDERENFHFVERSYGTFQRSVRLPFPADPEKVGASFENGVLTITLPKAAQLERSRRIQVQSGGGAGPAQGGQPQGGGAGPGGAAAQSEPTGGAGPGASGDASGGLSGGDPSGNEGAAYGS